jgi:hypothetical protein
MAEVEAKADSTALAGPLGCIGQTRVTHRGVLRLYLTCCLAAACGRSETGQIVASARPLDDALSCVLDRVVEQLGATRAPLDTFATALDVKGIPSNRAAVGRYITALANRVVAAGRDVALPKPVVKVRAAIALLDGDAPDGAGRLATEALAGSRELSQADHDDVVRAAALAITATGGDVPAEVRQGRDTFATLYAVQGLARSGRRDLARKLLAEVPPPTEVPSRGAYLVALGWLGDVAAARAMLDAAPHDPTLGVWLAEVLAHSKDPEARVAIDRDLNELEARASHVASPDEAVEIAGLWSELVWFREQQDRGSAREVRRHLDNWLLAKDDARRELLGVNVVRAAAAGDLAEAGRLEKALAMPLAAMAQIDLALLRDNVAAALDALAQQKTERQTAEQTTRRPPGELRDGIEIGEVTVWLVLAARRSVDPAMVVRFRALACAAGENRGR